MSNLEEQRDDEGLTRAERVAKTKAKIDALSPEVLAGIEGLRDKAFGELGDTLDGTQKWPMEGGNVWVGNSESSPYDDNGNDIQIGKVPDDDLFLPYTKE